MKKNKEELKQYFETGDKPTQEQFGDLIDSYIDAKQPVGVPNRRFVINENGEISVGLNPKAPEYSLTDIVANKLALLKDGEVVKEIDLTSYIDDTNLARLVSGSVDENGIATFTRDDESTLTVDFNSFLGNTTTPTLQEVLDAGKIANQSILLNEGGLQTTFNGGVSSVLGRSIKIRNTSASDGLEVKANTNDVTFRTPLNNTTTGGTDKLKLLYADNRVSGGDPDSKVAEFYGRVSGKDPQNADDFVTKSFADTNYAGGGSGQLQADWDQTDNTQGDFIKNKPIDDFTVIYKNKSVFDLITGQRTSTGTEENLIPVNRIFEKANTINSMDVFFTVLPRNGFTLVGSIPPEEIICEVLLEPVNAKVNGNSTGANSAIPLFKVKLNNQSDILYDKSPMLVSKNVEFLNETYNSSLGSFSRFSFREKVYDFHGNLLGSDYKVYNIQSADYTGSAGSGNFLIKDVDFRLKIRVTINFSDSNNSNGANHNQSTVIKYRGLVLKKF